MNRAHILVIGVLILFSAASIIGAYLYITTADSRGEDEMSRTVASVGRLMYLPEGEDPTVATVTDLEPLKGQPFFVNARIGYKVLIYTQAGKAILYDPKTDKIVEATSLMVENGTSR